MTATVYDFPREWYDLIVTQKFTLRSLSQVSGRPWAGGRNVAEPHVRLFTSEVTMAPQRDPVLQDMDAFFSRIKGPSGVLRLSNALRLAPWYDRNLSPTVATWSDSSLFTDGTGFANGFLPPEVFVATAAARGTNYIVLGGFPASITDVIRRGDLLEVKPNGIPGVIPHLYKAAFTCSSNSSGQVGIEIGPNLHGGIAAGDTVGLRYPSSLFRLADDTQGDIEGSGAGIGTFGFSVIEALDLVA